MVSRWISGPVGGRAPAVSGAATAIDAECGHFFRGLIGYLGVSRTELALRLECNAHSLEALERGDIGGLPPWPETVRIVTGLTAPAGIDPRPALRLLGQRWKASSEAPAGRPFRMPRVPPWAALARQTAAAVLNGARARLFETRLSLRAWVYAAAIAAPLAFAVFAARPAAFVEAASVPETFAGLFRETREFVLYQIAPQRDGLRWIEVDDPRLRRGDKLRTPL